MFPKKLRFYKCFPLNFIKLMKATANTPSESGALCHPFMNTYPYPQVSEKKLIIGKREKCN
jgi:hypothetical protein